MIVKYGNLNYKTDKIIKYTNYIFELYKKDNLHFNNNVNLKDYKLMDEFKIDYDELRRILMGLKIISLTEKETNLKSQRYYVDYSKATLFNNLCKAIEQEQLEKKYFIYNHKVEIDLYELELNAEFILKNSHLYRKDFGNKYKSIIYCDIYNILLNIYPKKDTIAIVNTRNYNY